MSRVEDLGEAGHELGHDGREDLVPCCQEQRCGGRISSVVSRLVYRGTRVPRLRYVAMQLTVFYKSYKSARSTILLEDYLGRGRGDHTELRCRKDPFVEEDDTGAQRDPETTHQGMACKVSNPDDDDQHPSDNARTATRRGAHSRDEEGWVQATKTSGAARSLGRALGGPALQLPVGLCRLPFACHGQCSVISNPMDAELRLLDCCVDELLARADNEGWQAVLLVAGAISQPLRKVQVLRRLERVIDGDTWH